MKKPYAESTLRRKYREAGIDPEKLEEIKQFLKACARFYGILASKDLCRLIEDFCGVTPEKTDEILPILERDEETDFYLESEDELFADGDADAFYLIDSDLVISFRDDFDYDLFMESQKSGEKYSGPPLFEEDYEPFYDLHKVIAGKPLYVPADLPEYADNFYYEETPETEAMFNYLLKELKWSPTAESKRLKRRNPELLANYIVLTITDIIRSEIKPNVDMFRDFLDILREYGYKVSFSDCKGKFGDLIFDLINNTRMIANRGYTPRELARKQASAGVPKVEFGPGYRKAFESGEIDPEELKRAFMLSKTVPDSMKAELARGIDEAAGAAVSGKKTPGQNDPCPCGSGKKYKKCCGAKK